jgi:hypothetical protein
MQMKIKHAELELHAGQIRVVVKHALERADRRLVIAEFGLEFGVAEAGVEIVRLNQEALEQEIGRDALLRIAHRRRGCSGLSLRRVRGACRLPDRWRRGKQRRADADGQDRAKSRRTGAAARCERTVTPTRP